LAHEKQAAIRAARKEKTVRFVSLFAGIGGFDLGLERAGMQCVGQVEINPFCQRVLAHHWPDVKRIGDIRNVNGTEFGAVDLICGGFPCQPFSTAGKRLGKADDRYLWPEMLAVIEAYRPTWVIGENVAGIIDMELNQVLSDLENKDYSCQPYLIPACAVDADHERKRVWIVAHSNRNGSGSWRPESEQSWQALRACSNDSLKDAAYSANPGIEALRERENAILVSKTERFRLDSELREQERQQPEPGWKARGELAPPCTWTPEPGVGRMANGIPGRVDRLRSLGNAVVPQVVEVIGRAIMATERAASMPQEAGPKDNIETCNTSCNT
jgi:DNA (cytosine-5)-methyltransferase 1